MDDIGELRHRLTWLSRTEGDPTPTSGGQPPVSYANRGNFWAKCEPLRGYELVNAQQLDALTDTKITLRNVGAIAPKDRFRFEGTGRVFNVESVTRRDEVGAVLDLLCSELVV